jgi:hypothetical protein
LNTNPPYSALGFTTSEVALPQGYKQLAAKRAATQCAPHKQPEDFGYDFRDWVSPYTKGAHKPGGLAVVLQDWSSSDGLAGPPSPEIQTFGRTPNLKTNVRLEQLLEAHFGLKLFDVYATNAFPFVKSGRMSAPLRISEVRDASRKFLLPELEMAKPKLILALGKVAARVLSDLDINCVPLPHPAARIGGLDKHKSAWQAALK